MSSSILVSDQSWSYTAEKDGNPDGSGTITRVSQLESTVTNGGPLLQWRKKIREGQNATTSSVGTKWTTMSARTNLQFGLQYKPFAPGPLGSRRNTIVGMYPYLGAPTMALDMAMTSAKNQAVASYYSNLSEVSTAFQGMVFTGELRESLQMILSPAKSLRRGVGDYLSGLRRRRKRMTKRQLAKMVSDSWLEAAFGWTPLINDVDTAIKAFYKSKQVKPIFQMVTGWGTDSKFSYTDRVQTADLGAGWWITWDKLIEESVYVKYWGITDSVGNGKGDSHHYGFKPSEFVPTLWELIPFSFLVDYFTNIGEIVSSWSYRWIGTRWTSELVRRTGGTSTPNARLLEDPQYSPSLYTLTKYRDEPGYLFIGKTSHVRTPSVSLGIPQFEVQCPGMSTKWVNIAALATSLALSRRSLNR